MGVIIKLNSVQLQMQLPAGTELGNNDRNFLKFCLVLKATKNLLAQT